jgi:predicted aspartyl protease
MGAFAAFGCGKASETSTHSPSQATAGETAAPKNAQEVLSRYIQAIGGEAALRKVHARTTEAKIVFLAEKDCDATQGPCTTEDTVGQYVRYSTDDGRSMRRVVVATRVEERGFDGKVGWQLQTDPPALILEEESAADQLREDGLLHWYFDVAKRGVEIRLEKPRDTDFSGQPRTLDGITWGGQGSKINPRTLWFDRQTGLLSAEVESAGEGEESVVQTTRYENYRAVDGVLVAHLVRETSAYRGRANEVELRVSAISHGEIREQVFAVPPPPQVEPQPDYWLDALNKARSEAQANPKDPFYQVAFARKAFEAAHFDEARLAATRTLAIDGKEPEAQWILARMDVMQGELERAKKSLEQAAKLGVVPEQIALARAVAAIELRKYDAAAKAYEEAGLGSFSGRFAAMERSPLRISGPCEVVIPTLLPKIPVIEAKADEHSIRAVVDTSAGDLVLGKSLAQKLSVSLEGEAPLILGGPNATYGTLPGLTVGNFTFTNVPVTVVTDEAIAAMVGLAGVDAVWGARLLANVQFTFDLPNSQLIWVHQTKACGKALKTRRKGLSYNIWTQDARYIYTMGSLNGSEGVYMVNTGMRGAALTANTAAFARAGIAPPPLRRGSAPLLRVDSFMLLGDRALSFVQPVALYGTLQDETTLEGHRFDGLLGIELLAARRFTFDLAKRTLFVEPGAPAAEKSASTSSSVPTSAAPSAQSSSPPAMPPAKPTIGAVPETPENNPK